MVSLQKGFTSRDFSDKNFFFFKLKKKKKKKIKDSLTATKCSLFYIHFLHGVKGSVFACVVYITAHKITSCPKATSIKANFAALGCH